MNIAFINQDILNANVMLATVGAVRSEGYAVQYTRDGWRCIDKVTGQVTICDSVEQLQELIA